MIHQHEVEPAKVRGILRKHLYGLYAASRNRADIDLVDPSGPQRTERTARFAFAGRSAVVRVPAGMRASDRFCRS